MTPIDRFERHLPMALTDLAVPQTPDYLTDILGRTARTRQRPAWASIERWLPMQLATSRVPVTRLPWRQLAVLALLALLLAAALAAYVGSQQRRLPPAFGPAANGQLVFAGDGDIYTFDPKTGVTKAIITGPGLELRPAYSPDGTHVLFARGGTLFVSRDDGSAAKQVTPEPLTSLSEWGFSPDGRSVVALARGAQGMAIIIADSEGHGQPRTFPVFATEGDGPPQYRPDGSEIMFIREDPGLTYRGVYALNPATSDVRTIIPPSTTHFDIHGASWSPDGRHVAYGVFDDSSAATLSKTHVVGVDGTGDATVDIDPASLGNWGFAWSNDSTRLIITRFYATDLSKLRSAIVPIDRSGAGIEIACPPGAQGDDCTADWTFSPDDSVLLGSFDGEDGTTAQFLGDPSTGEIRNAPWTATGHPAWQRLAP